VGSFSKKEEAIEDAKRFFENASFPYLIDRIVVFASIAPTVIHLKDC